MSKKFWTIATAIPYLNGDPHIGHALDYLLADTVSRYRKSIGDDVVFTAGTDEHGEKIFKKAGAEGLDVQTFVDQKAEIFKDFISDLNVEYTHFVRTTDEKHVQLCQEIWIKLSDHIYKDSYEGWYCDGCEAFVTDKEYAENNGICPDHQKAYQKLNEENYYLRISDFKDEIRTAIETDRLEILPKHRKNEFLNLLKDMPDVSISRPKAKVSWGIPVPNDDEQVMYVWIDALSNYITAFDYPEKEISDYWPADLQVLGKDILRFHAGIWPAMLIGLGLELPKTFLTHGYISVDGQKMSKSIGNVVDPREAIAKHGTEAFRYYFLRHVSTTDDADFSWEKYEAGYNELANVLGNLVQRLANLCAKNEVPGQELTVDYDPEYIKLMDGYELNKAFDYAWEKAQKINQKIDEEKPWALVKESPEAGQSLLTDLVRDLLIVNKHLTPFLPETTKRIESIFTAKEIAVPETPLFPKN